MSISLPSDFFDLEPQLTPLRQRHWWVMTHDWTCRGFVIPRGFLTDFDSVPTIPFVYAIYKGRARRAPLLHDYHYATGIVSKEEADRTFYEMMLEEDVGKKLAKQMYNAVRLFGGRYYNKFEKLDPKHRIDRRMLGGDGYAECLVKPISKE